MTWLALAGLVSADASVPADSPLGQLVAERPVSTATTLPRLPVLFGLALENDSDLQSQRYQVKATEEQVDMAWSQLKPQVSVSGGYTYQESDNYYTDNPDYDPANDFVDTDYEARYAGQTKDAFWQLSLSQPLFSVERWRGVDKAESQVEAAQLQLALGESELAMAVVEAYLDALLASRQTGLLESKRESLELQHRQASRAYELGVGDRLNVLEAQARLDQTISDRILAENQLEDALGELERLTGTRPAFGQILGDLQAVELPGIEGSIDDWLSRSNDNLEVLLADRQLQVARADTSARRGGYYPELSLNVSYSDRDSNDPYRESRDGRASVQLEMPIYRGGYTSANVSQGEYSTLSSESALMNARRIAGQQVRQSFRNIEGHRRRLDALGRSIDSSRLFLAAAEKGEQLGLRDLVDVLDARADLYDLRIQYVQTVRDYLFERLKLEVAVGDLGTDDLVRTMITLQALVRPAQVQG
ncbi:TolC family outer membrane protein [Halomonas litopenaei]|uniref:TolC family outer membrane protein n=1 Tax=Halomonas litopenaei TaxID=2109328 RepID=UPI003FA103D5